MVIKTVAFDFGHTLIDERNDDNVPLESRPIHLMPGVSEVLPFLPLPLAVWANTRTATEAELRQWLERAGIGRFFAWVVTSVDAGFRKPAPEFFDFALAKCALSKDEVLFVGNQLSTNIRVASNTESALSGYADALTAVLMKHSRPRMFAPPTQSALFANFRFSCNASAILRFICESFVGEVEPIRPNR